MKNRSSHWVLTLLLLASLTGNVQAQDEETKSDARVEGYQLTTGDQGTVGPLLLKEGRGAAATWFTLAGLGLLGIGVMFKSGKRTHLD